MTGFLLRGLIAALGLWLASNIVPGFAIEGVGTLIAAALLLGVVNAVLRPIFFFLTLPLTVMTLGLFILVVNGAMVGLVGWLLKGMIVDGFWPAVLGALVIGLTSWVASWFIGGQGKPRPMAGD